MRILPAQKDQKLGNAANAVATGTINKNNNNNSNNTDREGRTVLLSPSSIPNGKQIKI